MYHYSQAILAHQNSNQPQGQNMETNPEATPNPPPPPYSRPSTFVLMSYIMFMYLFITHLPLSVSPTDTTASQTAPLASSPGITQNMLASALSMAASPTSSLTSSLPSSVNTRYLQPPPSRPHPSQSGPSSLPSYPPPPQPPRRSNSNPGREGNPSSLSQADLQRALQSIAMVRICINYYCPLLW